MSQPNPVQPTISLQEAYEKECARIGEIYLARSALRKELKMRTRNRDQLLAAASKQQGTADGSAATSDAGQKTDA